MLSDDDVREMLTMTGKSGNFLQLRRGIFEKKHHGVLRGETFRVFAFLAAIANTKREPRHVAEVSCRQVARLLGIGINTVRRCIDALENAGYAARCLEGYRIAKPYRQAGSKIDQGWIQNGSPDEIGWIRNGSKVDPKRIQGGSETDPGVDPKRIQDGSETDPPMTPNPKPVNALSAPYKSISKSIREEGENTGASLRDAPCSADAEPGLIPPGVKWSKVSGKVEMTEQFREWLSTHLAQIAEDEKLGVRLTRAEAQASLGRLNGHLLRNRMKTGKALPAIVANWFENDLRGKAVRGATAGQRVSNVAGNLETLARWAEKRSGEDDAEGLGADLRPSGGGIPDDGGT